MLKMPKGRLYRGLLIVYLIVLVVRGAFGYAEIAQLISKGQMFALEINGRPYVSDFVVFYSAASLGRQAQTQRISIYDHGVQESNLKQLLAPVVPEVALCQLYPPYFYVLVAPLAFFSMFDAWKVWSLLGLLCILTSVYLLCREGLNKPLERVFLLVATLASFPCCLSFRAGQTSFYLLLGLTMFWVLLRNKRFVLAGIASALCLLKVQYLPLVFLTGLVLGRHRYALGFVASLLSLLGLSWLMLGANNIWAYPVALMQFETKAELSTVHPDMMQNFRGAFYSLFGGADTSGVWLLTSLVLVIGCVAVTRGWLKQGQAVLDKPMFLVGAAITSMFALLISPHTHIQDYLIMVIPGAYLWLWLKSINEGNDHTRLLQFLLVAFPGISWTLWLTVPVLQKLGCPPYALWVLAVLAVTVWLLKAQSGGRPAEQPYPSK